MKNKETDLSSINEIDQLINKLRLESEQFRGLSNEEVITKVIDDELLKYKPDKIIQEMNEKLKILHN